MKQYNITCAGGFKCVVSADSMLNAISHLATQQQAAMLRIEQKGTRSKHTDGKLEVAES